MIGISKKILKPESDADNKEQTWDNPLDPEKAEDERDTEQLIRQKHEAERRKENLDTDDYNKGDN
jgi:hypothetical protein